MVGISDGRILFIFPTIKPMVGTSSPGRGLTSAYTYSWDRCNGGGASYLVVVTNPLMLFLCSVAITTIGE